MRAAALGLLTLLWLTPLWAQEQSVPTGVDPTAESIQSRRVRETAALDAEEAACYQRFAVSACLQNVQSRRRAVLAELRHQEALMHERESAQRAAEQRQRIAQKIGEKQQHEAELLTNGSAEADADKLQVQRDKQEAHATKAGASAAASQNASLATGPSPAQQAANRESFERKQADAEKKRQDMAKQQAEKSGKVAAPLPLPQ